MSVDLAAAEALQTGEAPHGLLDRNVDAAGTPLPTGAKFDSRGYVRGADGGFLKGFKRRADLADPDAPPAGRTPGKKSQAQEVKASPPTAAPATETEKPPKMTRARAELKLSRTWGQFWDLCAEGWDDESLRVTERERQEWAEPVAYVAEQMGWLHHTEKLDYVAAVTVTGKQALPRAMTMLTNHPRPFSSHPDGQQAPPEFRRPAGMGRRGAPVGMPPDKSETALPQAAPTANGRPPIAAEGAAHPMPIDPLFLPRESEL